MELRDVLAAVRGSWGILLAGLVLGGGAAFGATLLQTPLFTSHTQFFVSTTDTTSTNATLQGSQFSQQRVASYARLLTGEELASRVVDRLELEISPQSLRERIAASTVGGTVLIDVAVTDPSADNAERIAEAVGEEFTQLVSELEAPGEGGVSPVKVTVTDEPDVPASPSSPATITNVLVGALLGGLIAVGFVIIRARLDRTVRDPEEAAQLAGAPLIGTIVRDPALEKRHTIEREEQSRTAEDYRRLRTNLQFLSVDAPPKVIMVSSALPSEGKTTLVINLAMTLSEAGRTVTVVEADLRRPKVTRYLGMVGGVGLTNVLAGAADLEEVRQTYGDGTLSVIASGPTPPNPGELLASHHMQDVLDKLRGQNDYILVDAPPLLPVADSSGLAAYVDGVLLSVRYGSTTKDQLAEAAAGLARVGARTLGVVLNIVPPKAESASAYGYGVTYGYDPKHAS